MTTTFVGPARSKPRVDTGAQQERAQQGNGEALRSDPKLIDMRNPFKGLPYEIKSNIFDHLGTLSIVPLLGVDKDLNCDAKTYLVDVEFKIKDTEDLIKQADWLPDTRRMSFEKQLIFEDAKILYERFLKLESLSIGKNGISNDALLYLMRYTKLPNLDLRKTQLSHKEVNNRACNKFCVTAYHNLLY